jgi:hypothetical protein
MKHSVVIAKETAVQNNSNQGCQYSIIRGRLALRVCRPILIAAHYKIEPNTSEGYKSVYEALVQASKAGQCS